MTKLEQLIQEACERFDEKFWGFKVEKATLCGVDFIISKATAGTPYKIKKFMVEEIKNAIQTAFTLTKIPERYTRDIESTGYNSALSDTKIKQTEFLNN